MKIALDPFMFRSRPIDAVVRLAAEIGFEHLEWSWRDDVIPLLRRPRADAARIAEIRHALDAHRVGIASLVALYRWSSTDPDERTAAVRYWRRVIEIAAELGCERVNTEFGGDPATPTASEEAWTRSIDELLPLFERAGLTVSIEPHPGDFVEDGLTAVDLIRSVDSPRIRYLYCAPHTFHMGHDLATLMRYGAPVMEHVHVADTMNHLASSGLRFIVNPLGAPVRVHQHLDVGEGEVEWDTFFAILREVRFDGIVTSSVFSREERAEESSRYMLGVLREGTSWARDPA